MTEVNGRLATRIVQSCRDRFGRDYALVILASAQTEVERSLSAPPSGGDRCRGDAGGGYATAKARRANGYVNRLLPSGQARLVEDATRLTLSATPR